MQPKQVTVAALVAAILCAAHPAAAVIIDLIKLEPADVYGTHAPSQVTGTPDQDGVLEVPITKSFFLVDDPSLPRLLPMVLEFQLTLQSEDDLRLARLDLHEDVYNGTGIAWTDYHFFLENLPPGEGFAGAGFNNFGPPDSEPLGSPVDSGKFFLGFEGGPVPGEPGNPGLASFDELWVEFPDQTLAVGPTYVFRIKQQPTPEPATLLLIGVAALALLPRRLRVG